MNTITIVLTIITVLSIASSITTTVLLNTVLTSLKPPQPPPPPPKETIPDHIHSIIMSIPREFQGSTYKWVREARKKKNMSWEEIEKQLKPNYTHNSKAR